MPFLLPGGRRSQSGSKPCEDSLRPLSGESARRARVGFYCDAKSWGGAEIPTATLLARLPDWIEPVVIGVDEHVVNRLAAASGRALLKRLRPPSGLRDLRSIIEHRQTMVELRLEMVQISLPSAYAGRAALVAAATVRGLTVVVIEHSALHPASLHSRYIKRVLELSTDAHVAVGDSVAKTIETWARLATGSITAIRNGVVDPGPIPRTIEGGGPVTIATLARLDYLKGLDVLIDAAPNLPEVRFRVGGDGPDRELLIRRAESLGVADRFQFLGWTDPAAVLTDSDIFVLPSRAEGLPLSVLESMMRGLPVVATDVGSVSEAVVDGWTGFLVEPGDPRSLGVALGRLADDAELRRRMGRAGRERALERFGTGRMVSDYVRLYAELLGRDETGLVASTSD